MAALLPRAPLSWLLLPLIVGYLAADFLPNAPGFYLFSGLVFALISFASVSVTEPLFHRFWSGAILLGGILLAAGHLQLRLKPPAGWSHLPPREARLTISIDRLFSSSVERGAISGLAQIRDAEAHLSELIGRKIYFSIGPSEENRLWPKETELLCSGILEALAEKPTDDFERHLSRTGAQFSYRKMTLREKPRPARGFFAFCERQNKRFEQFLRKGASENETAVGVYVAMMLGKRSELNEEQEKAYLTSGAMHLFSISGLHIGVIAFSLHNLLTLLRLPPKSATVIGLLLLFIFVGIIGAPPSAVRAFIMAAFFWTAHFFVRVSNPIAALANSALFVLLLFPGLLWSPGFQLSYAVVSGILFLGLPLGRHFQKKWTPFAGIPLQALGPIQRGSIWLMRHLTGTLAISLSATLLSSPLTIHYFEIFTAGAVLLNLLLIPLATMVIVAGFISILLNLMMLAPLAVVYNHAAWMILKTMEKISFASLQLPLFWNAEFPAPWVGPVTLLLLIAVLLLCASQKWRAPFFHYIVPFLMFVIVLLSAVRLTFPSD